MTELSDSSANLLQLFLSFFPDFQFPELNIHDIHCHILVSHAGMDPLAMPQIPTPPASRHGSISPDPEHKQAPTTDLTQTLDDLLERYLHLLDQHQKLQSQMASCLSSGFISLAQANYACPPGRRYGEDYYDDRMKATRRMTIRTPCTTTNNLSAKDEDQSDNSDTFEYTFQIETVRTEEPEEDPKNDRPPSPKNSDPSDDESALEKDATKPSKVPDSPKPSNPGEASRTESEYTTTSESKSKSKTKPRSSDPLRWYGILVPPSLRSAQKSFTAAVEGHLSELANVTVEMQSAEKEIARVREELGRAQSWCDRTKSWIGSIPR
ncbi:hypothetical protein BJX96DRAFT_36896 [Aspergillus floccosus]